MISRLACLLALCCALSPTVGLAETNRARPNVLLICVDDLRTELGCMGVKGIQSPNIDRLASQGRLFTRHYVQIAACGPSRCTLLTGQRVITAWDVWDKDRRLKEQPESPVSFVHQFRRQGYRTVGIGKVAHYPDGGRQVPFSWDLSIGPTDRWNTTGNAFFGYADGTGYNATGAYGCSRSDPRLPYEAADVNDHGYSDAHNADLAIEQLQDLSKRDQPFFLAVGFFRPHLPFNAPKKYWDLYDPMKIPPAPWPKPPAQLNSKMPFHNSYEVTTHYKWPSGVGNISAEEGRTLKHGYWASVSYVDAQIGRVLDECQRLGMDRNTVVVLWSDHGWHLGDHGIWGKYTNYEWALHSPLIIRTPDTPKPGTPTDAIVETIDVYPTLVDLCGLDAPQGLPGKSFRPAIVNPNDPGKAGARGNVLRGRSLGTTLRTDRYRLVRWTVGEKPGLIELYDHQRDPYETKNIAAEEPRVVAELVAQLNADG